MTSTDTTALRKAIELRILKLLKTMWSHEDAARAFSDPKGVHQMRVSSRKVRSALDASRDVLDGKRARKVRKGVRVLTRALGGVRDGDVLLAELEELLSSNGDGNRPGIARLSDRLTRERDAARDHLITVLDDLQASGFLEESMTAFNGSKPKGKKPRIRPRDARSMVEDHIFAFVDQTRTIPTEDEVEALHDIRIATKRLRYTLQFVEKSLAPESTVIIGKLADLQDQLGEIHNQDVLIDLIKDELHSMFDQAADLAMRVNAPLSQYDQASWQDLLGLLFTISERRRTWYASFLERWRELESEGFADDLLALARPRRSRNGSQGN
jgi:CHAD domain-containing protein